MALIGSRKYQVNLGQVIAVTGTAASSGVALAKDENYVLAVNVDIWFRTDGTAAAVDAAGSHLMLRGATDITGSGTTISVIKDTGEADGEASIAVGVL